MTKPKKTTAKKEEVQESKLHVPFDLNIDSKEKAEMLVGHLVVLENTAGWQIVKQILEGNISVLERQIVLKQGVSGENLTDAQVDDLRKVRNVMEELVEKPKALIEQFRKQSPVLIPTYDPYAQNVSEFSSSKNMT